MGEPKTEKIVVRRGECIVVLCGCFDAGVVGFAWVGGLVGIDSRSETRKVKKERGGGNEGKGQLRLFPALIF